MGQDCIIQDTLKKGSPLNRRASLLCWPTKYFSYFTFISDLLYFMNLFVLLPPSNCFFAFIFPYMNTWIRIMEKQLEIEAYY